MNPPNVTFWLAVNAVLLLLILLLGTGLAK